MVAQVVELRHPILACAQTLNDALSEVADVQPLYMSLDAQRAALVQLDRVRRRLDELHLRLVAAAGEVAEVDGARDVAAWRSARLKADHRAARAEQALALALDGKWHQVQGGMATGVVSTDQARAIVAGLEALPTDLDADLIPRAEAHLVGLAADHTPREIRILARHLLDTVAPDIAEAEEAKRLEREEQTAREKTRFSYKVLGDGTARGTIVLPEADMVRLATSLEAFASPRKTEGVVWGEEDRIPYPRRLGQAFCALLEHLDPHRLPNHGGDTTTLMVTMTREALESELGVGHIVGSGETMSTSAVRRLACNAGIIPVVLGGKGEILDLGRTRRLHNPAQRKAMRLRDGHCRAEGCTIPAQWCEAHHLKPWSSGGKTTADDGVLLCAWHHHRIHDRRYEHQRRSGGDLLIRRRT